MSTNSSSMGSGPASQTDRQQVWALVALPPPVTGMTLLTEKVVNGLREKTSVRVINWSAGDARPRFHTRIRRFLRAAKALATLIVHGRVRDGRAYVTANNKGGLLMTGLIVNAARRLGYSVFLHHHAYTYIDHFDNKMAWIVRSMGPDGVHVVHCSQMVEDFRATYPESGDFEFVFPSIVSSPLELPRQRVREPFQLGFLSNLSVEKGLDLVLEAFRVLHERGRNVRLCLAGPANTDEAQRLVDDAVKKYDGRVMHVGAVYGGRKVEFYKSIDAFVFPTKTESWGIVLNEAMAAGVPVISTDRGSIRTLVGNGAGLIVKDAARFVDEAVRQVENWIDSPQVYSAASQAAVQQADYLHREATVQLERLVSRICSLAESATADSARVAV
jgi:glycosyltransferase involved in cell wall biosynthesis